MQTVSVPSRLLDQAKAAIGTRSGRTAVVRALEKIIQSRPPDRLRPDLTRAILAQRGKRGREFNSVHEANEAIDQGKI